MLCLGATLKVFVIPLTVMLLALANSAYADTFTYAEGTPGCHRAMKEGSLIKSVTGEGVLVSASFAGIRECLSYVRVFVTNKSGMPFDVLPSNVSIRLVPKGELRPVDVENYLTEKAAKPIRAINRSAQWGGQPNNAWLTYATITEANSKGELIQVMPFLMRANTLETEETCGGLVGFDTKNLHRFFFVRFDNGINTYEIPFTKSETEIH